MTGGMLVLANANALQNSTLDTGAVGNQSVNLTMPEATTYNIGGLKGSANFDLAVSNLSVGSNNQSTTYDGVLMGAFNNSLTKVGTGTLTLTGANTYGGSTTVSNGALQVGNGGAGQTGTGALIVTGSATLLGTGTVRASSATFASNAVVRPGDSVADSSHGVLTFTPIGIGAYDFQAGSKVIMGVTTATSTDVTFGGNNVGTAGYNTYVDGITGVGSHDKLVFNGTAGSTLAFSGSLSVLPSNYTAQVGDVFNLLDWSALISPDFSGFDVGTNYRDGSGDNGSQLDLPDLTSTPGLLWDVSRFTTSGNIVVVPEPGRVLLLDCGFLCLLMRRRRPSRLS
jgi:autotransporter-associated beta strand protein